MAVVSGKMQLVNQKMELIFLGDYFAELFKKSSIILKYWFLLSNSYGKIQIFIAICRM